MRWLCLQKLSKLYIIIIIIKFMLKLTALTCITHHDGLTRLILQPLKHMIRKVVGRLHRRRRRRRLVTTYRYIAAANRTARAVGVYSHTPSHVTPCLKRRRLLGNRLEQGASTGRRGWERQRDGKGFLLDIFCAYRQIHHTLLQWSGGRMPTFTGWCIHLKRLLRWWYPVWT